MSMKSRLLTVLFGFSVALSLGPQVAVADDAVASDEGTAAAVEYPGSRRVYTVSLGQIPPPGSTSTRTWVRLATYYFMSDGKVKEAFFYFDRDTAVGAELTGVIATKGGGCDGCEVRTVKGFEPSDDGKSLMGTYRSTATAVTISWDGGATETWNISHPASDLARIDLASSSYGANIGYGFGSNASTNTFFSVGNIPKKLYPGRITKYAGGAAGGKWNEVSGMNLAPFSTCSGGNCLSDLSAPTDTCGSCPNGETESPIRYYLASGGRRNFYEHWCTCLLLKGEVCYTRDSHRKPQLQVIGDQGAFHGWVGVEASTKKSVPGTGEYQVHYHVDI